MDSWRCVSECVYVRVPICKCTGCMYVCMCVCIYVCMCVCMYACMHVCMYVCMYNPQVSLLTYCICPQLDQMCPFPESFLRAISCAEEFSPLPNASSPTGSPIILIPYRDGEGEVLRGGGVQRLLIIFIYCCFLKRPNNSKILPVK